MERTIAMMRVTCGLFAVKAPQRGTTNAENMVFEVH
jgi:hypothetical protein